ncbi:MAG: hypothetical protein ACRDXX_16630 [Stackebrandtia sp.]
MKERWKVNPVWTVLLVLHAIAVLPPTAVFLSLLTLPPDYPEVPIGLLLGGVVLLLEGLPWSIPILASGEALPSGVGYYLIPIGTALLNVGIHALVYRAVTTRRLRKFAGSAAAPAS